MGRSEDGRGETAPFPKPSWKHRRRLIYGTLILDALVIVAATIGWLMAIPSSTVATVLVSGAYISSLFILSAYVFGAVVEDISLHKILSSLKPEVSFGGFGSDEEDNRRV